MKTSRGPHEIHFNADRSGLYVARSDDDAIDIVGVAELGHRQRDTTSNPGAFGIDEKRCRLYVADREGSSVAIIDLDQNIVKLIRAGPMGGTPAIRRRAGLIPGPFAPSSHRPVGLSAASWLAAVSGLGHFET